VENGTGGSGVSNLYVQTAIAKGLPLISTSCLLFRHPDTNISWSARSCAMPCCRRCRHPGLGDPRLLHQAGIGVDQLAFTPRGWMSPSPRLRHVQPYAVSGQVWVNSTAKHRHLAAESSRRARCFAGLNMKSGHLLLFFLLFPPPPPPPQNPKAHPTALAQNPHPGA